MVWPGAEEGENDAVRSGNAASGTLNPKVGRGRETETLPKLAVRGGNAAMRAR